MARRAANAGPAQAPLDPRVGLCARCRHARVQRSAAGSRFWRCRLPEPRRCWPRYPPLPVLECPGFQPGPPADLARNRAGSEGC